MIYIFDLDDTLYDERQFVESGFRAVATMAQNLWDLNVEASFNTLISILDNRGRGKIFNEWLAPFGLDTKKNIKACVSTYRLHKPDISMPEKHMRLLEQLPKPLYLVTDGNKIVQKNKVNALGIDKYFKRIFITHRFGVKHAKPSIYCFELIKKAERCEWQDMVYIGDNPAKDFVNLNKVGMKTVRVLTGVHRGITVPLASEASLVLATLADFDTEATLRTN